MSNHNAPTKKFTAFPIQVVVWENTKDKDGVEKTYKSFQIERLYKTSDGQWKSTQSLNADDLPKAVALLQQAYAAEVVTVERPPEQ